METSKTGSLSNGGLIGILLGGIAALSVIFYLVGPDKISGPASTQDHTAQSVATSSAEEIDLWIKEGLKNAGPIAVVNVWATWCEPCRKEMPEIAKFQKTYPQIPVFLISADNENDVASVQNFLKEAGVEFHSKLIKAPQETFIETWQQRSAKDPGRRWSMGLPVTFFLNKEGNVEKFHSSETNAAELAAIASNLGANMAMSKSAKPNRPEDL